MKITCSCGASVEADLKEYENFAELWLVEFNALHSECTQKQANCSDPLESLGAFQALVQQEVAKERQAVVGEALRRAERLPYSWAAGGERYYKQVMLDEVCQILEGLR